MRFTISGCGSSGGVPRIGNDWGSCNSNNPKNRRRRCSLLVENLMVNGEARVVIDTSPDMRDQMLSAGVDRLDAVWYTHEHADHTHGIDELRAFYIRQRQRIPVWASAGTTAMLKARFGYCFETQAGSDYSPILDLHQIDLAADVISGSIKGKPIVLRHGNIDALGFRIGGLAYTPDVNDIPQSSLESLQGLDVWIVDALRPVQHPSHFSLPETLAWIERLKPKRAILTNMHVDLDFDALRRDLPPGVEPAYDGLVVELENEGET